ncbi:MAG: chemotaxis protein CheW [Pseudomonadota bacterium]|nr:chemotaxis protein CheW [Pseudomonadota bacterium]
MPQIDPSASTSNASPPPPAPPPDTEHSATRVVRSQAIYGSFWLDDTEFALSAGVIREVVNEPKRIAPMPLAPPFMLGLFNLRGKIIPVVDLRLLLEFPDRHATERKVAIIEDDDLCIGIMVDRTGEVLNVQGASRVDFRPRKGRVKDVVVEGLLKLEDGERIVQILDPYEILNLEKIPRGELPAGQRVDTAVASRGPRLNCISFQFGHTTCAIDLRHVREVMEAPEIMDSVLVHDCFIGITNLRGAIIPVADFRNFMGDVATLKSSEEIPPKRKMLIIQTDGGAIGLLVYSIDSIISFFEDEVLPFTKLALPRADIVRGCVLNKQNDIVMMLDYEALKADEILVDTALRCREIYPSEAEVRTTEVERAGSARLTFIIFTFDRAFALDTTQVSEVINYPDTLLQPPYAIDFVEGIINLRDELISLINPRRLYGMPASGKGSEKVLIFKDGGSKYGILVDSVDEIVITTENQVAEMNMLAHQDSKVKVTEDICGCVHSPTRGSVMILDTGALLKRCFNTAGSEALEALAAD